MIITGEHFRELINKHKKISETIVPELIHRLIRETINCGAYTRFPANDDIFTPGFDGVVTGNTALHRFCPTGNIYFEIGTNKDCCKSIEKINTDYNKRKTDSFIEDKKDFTYVAITTSILDSKKKQGKCNVYIKENIFKTVLILDAIDITSWMEEHINICIWFLQKYGEKLDDYDISLVSDEWDRISKTTIPNLSSGLFTIGNQRNSEKMIQDLREMKTNRIFTISSEHYGRDFSYAFCVSAIMRSSDKGLIERAIVVNSQLSMNYVNAFCKDKIVLVNFNCLDDRFAITLTNTYIFFVTLFDADIDLDLIAQKEFVQEVVNLGYSRSESFRISFLVDYNVLALRRFLTKIPSIKIPLWSKQNNKNELIPLLLMGEINMDKTVDLEFLKAMIGDDIDSYTEKLNLWAEMNQSPILKYKTVYRICSRKECFDFLQVDMFSSKLKAIEKQMILVLSRKNEKYKKSSDGGSIDDVSYETYERKDSLISRVLDGFIILSDKNKQNQLHFDLFVKKVLDNIYGNYELALAISDHIKKLCELSPYSYISFLRNLITTDSDSFSNNINTTSPVLLSRIAYALVNSLRHEKYALSGFEALLDMYYIFPDNTTLFEEIIKCLSPGATLSGLIYMPFLDKIKFFFEYIENKDYTNTFKIVEKIYKDDNNLIIIGGSPSYRNHIGKEITVTYHELFYMESRAFNWLIENEKDPNELIQTLKDILQNIYFKPLETIKNQLTALEGKLLFEKDEVKAKAYREIRRTREKMLKRDDRENSERNVDIVDIFDGILTKIKPTDNYIYSKYVLIDDYYPLLNPPSINDCDWYKKENQLREKEKRRLLKKLIEENGQSVIKKIIEDCTCNSSLIWQLIYEISDNHLRDLETILNNELSIGLRMYMSCMDNQEIDAVLKKYENNSLVIQNLPYSKKIYTWIDGRKKEKEYWRNQYFGSIVEDDFEYIFEKFINFAPEKMFDACPYIDEIDYEHSLRLLHAVSELIYKDPERELFHNKIGFIQDFVKKMDRKYYTEELSLCEIKLLPVLKSGMEDYPMGIKKYFWDHPNALGKILVQINEQKDSLPSGSLEQKMYFGVLIGTGCYIPNEYIVQKRCDIKSWVEGVLSGCKNEDKMGKRFLKTAIIKSLAACPKQFADNIWPIKEVADVLEGLAFEDFEGKYNVSSLFASEYINRIGVREVNDGTLEFSLSEEFESYQIHYQYSHPVTSKALEFISSDYNEQAEFWRTSAYLGHKY